MASIEEVKGAAAGLMDRLRGVRAQQQGVHQIVEECGSTANYILQGSGREEASAALSRIRSAEQAIDDSIANCGIAIEQLEQLVAAL